MRYSSDAISTSGRRRRVAAAIGVALALIGLAFRAPTAGAALISGAITNVVVNPPAGAGGGLRVDESWCVPDGTKSGDTFTQTLPDQLGGFPAGFELTDASGQLVATAAISPTKPTRVTFTMTAYAETHQHVCGTAHFTGYAAQRYAGTDQTLVTTNDDGTTFTSKVTIPPSKVIDHGKGVKTGWFSTPSDQCRTEQTDCITWAIDSPLGPLASGSMTDIAPAGEVFDCAKVATYLGDATGPNGAFAHGVPYGSGVTISCTPTQVSASFGALPAGKMLQLSIPASLTSGDNAGDVRFQNTASITSTTDGVPVSSMSSAYLRSSSAGGQGSGDTAPAITIVKGDADGNAADTAATAANIGYAPAAMGLVYSVTNNGKEPLRDVTVTDQLVTNGTVTGLSCDFSAVGGPASGTVWAGPLAVGASFPCTAQLSGVQLGDHEDIATVTAAGAVSGSTVRSSNPYFAIAVATPPIVTGAGSGAPTVNAPGVNAPAVNAPAVNAPAGSTPPVVSAAQYPPALAATGAATGVEVGLGATLLLVGSGLMVFTRRRA
jgi:hypothetical protein